MTLRSKKHRSTHVEIESHYYSVPFRLATSRRRKCASRVVRHTGHASIEAGELAVKRGVVQSLFHRRIGQAEPLLQEVDAQHGLDGKARTTAFGACARRLKWLDQTHQFCPRHNQAHLIEKHTLARALGDKLESGGGKADLFHARSTPFRPASLSGFCRGSLAGAVAGMLAAGRFRSNVFLP